MFWYKQFYVCALVGVLIKWLYEMHGATIKMINQFTLRLLEINRYFHPFAMFVIFGLGKNILCYLLRYDHAVFLYKMLLPHAFDFWVTVFKRNAPSIYIYYVLCILHVPPISSLFILFPNVYLLYYVGIVAVVLCVLLSSYVYLLYYVGIVVVVLCVLLSSYVYLLYYVGIVAVVLCVLL
jgi:hypothetical protein